MADELQFKITAQDKASAALANTEDKVKRLRKELNKAGEAYLKTGEGAQRVEQLQEELDNARAAAAAAKREIKAMGEATKKAATTGATSASKLHRAWGKVQKLFSNPLVAGASIAGVTLFAKNAIDQFARVQDASDALGATFGSTGDKIIDWANTSADALNLSQSQALDAAQTFAIFGDSAGLAGDQLVQFSTTLAERAADAASYFGGTTADAIEAFGSALRGEAEPARKYGVLLDDATLRQKALTLGITDTIKTALTPQQKILAANAVLLEQTARVNGDVARTADSMANKIKDSQQQFADLQANVGETVAVGLSPLLSALNSAMQMFNQLPGPVQSVAIAIGLVGAAALVAGPRLIDLNNALEAKGGLVGVAKKWRGVGVAIGTLATALVAAKAATDALTGGEGFRPWADSAKDVGRALDTLIRGANNEFGFIIAVGEKLGIATTAGTEAERTIKATDAALVELVASGKADEAARQFDKWRTKAEGYGASFDEIVTYLFPMYFQEVVRANSGTSAFATTVAWAKQQTEPYAGSINLLVQAHRNADAAARGLNGALQGVNDTIARNQAMRAYEDALAEFIKNPTQEAGEAVELAMTNAASTFKKPEKAAKFVTTAVGDIETAVKNSGLDKDIKTALTDPLDAADRKAQNVLDKANALNAFKPKPIDFVVTVNGQPVASAADARAALLGADPFKAAGGPVAANRPYIVGEVGPELFMPRVGPMKVIGADGPELRQFNQPGVVIPNHLVDVVTQQQVPVAAAVGATVNVTVNNPQAGIDVERAVMRAMTRAERVKRERG